MLLQKKTFFSYLKSGRGAGIRVQQVVEFRVLHTVREPAQEAGVFKRAACVRFEVAEGGHTDVSAATHTMGLYTTLTCAQPPNPGRKKKN